MGRSRNGPGPFHGRWRRLLIVAAIAIPFLLFIALFLVGTMTADGPAWIRVRGHRIPISATTARIIFGSVGLGFLAVILLVVGAGARDAWNAPRAKAPAYDALDPGEQLLWQGRPGLRSLVGPRLPLLLLALGAPALFGWWIWSNLTSSDVLSQRLFWALFPTAGLCFWVIPPLVAGSGTMLNWVRDVFGSVVVTDRRIVWLSPRRGSVYREIDGSELITAGLVEPERGWVTVTRQRGRRVTEIDLFGLFPPEQALAAIEAMMAGFPANNSESLPPGDSARDDFSRRPGAIGG